MAQNNYVLDVNVYISFIAGKKLFKLAAISEKGIKMYTSSALFDELIDVLNRPKIKKYLSTPVSDYINIIEEFTIPGPDTTLSRLKNQSPDKDDHYLFELAFQTESVLVTGDKELLYWKESPVAVISVNSFLKLF